MVPRATPSRKQRHERKRRKTLIAGVAVVLVFAAHRAPASLGASAPPALAVEGFHTALGAAPGVGGQVHRLFTRSERSMTRFASTAVHILAVWFGFVLSALVFLLIAAVSSVADVRMLDLRRHGPAVLARDLAHGVRTFFRLLRDRRTPYGARAVLALALIYWLLPLDLIQDGVMPLGVLDDLVVAVISAKAFVYLCPDALIAANAADVQAHA